MNRKTRWRFLQRSWENFGTSLTVVVVCLCLLAIASHVTAVDNLAQVEQWVDGYNDNRTITWARFSEPEVKIDTQNKERCSIVTNRRTPLLAPARLPNLPKEVIAVQWSNEREVKSHAYEDAVWKTLDLDYPLCAEPEIVLQDSFIDPKPVRDFQIVQTTLDADKLPYPGNLYRFVTDSEPGKGRFVVHPVQVLNPMRVRVLQEVTLVLQTERPAFAAKASVKAAINTFATAKKGALHVRAKQEGLYAVTGSKLAEIPDGTPASDIKVTFHGQSLAREVSYSGSSVSRILFWLPETVNDFYEDEASVWIDWSASGKDVGIVDGDPLLAAAGNSIYQETRSASDCQRYWHSLPIDAGLTDEGDPMAPPWTNGYCYWRLMFQPGPWASLNFDIDLDEVVASSDVTIDFRLRGLSYYDEDDYAPSSDQDDHSVNFYLNSSLLGSETFDDQAYVTPQFVVNTTLIEGTNTLKVEIPGGTAPSGKYESHAFYGYDVTYWRNMVAQSDYLDFSVASIASYTVSGFSHNDIRVFFASGTALDELDNVDITYNGSDYEAAFAATTPGRYIAVADGSYMSPDSVAINSKSYWQIYTEGADMIIVAGEGLNYGANLYKDYRDSSGELSTIVVSAQDIFDEYNYGHTDPLAIRHFVLDALSRWTTKPKYLFLIGDTNNDPLGLYNSANRNPPLPLYYDSTDYLQIANDQRFVMDDNDSSLVGKIAVGRLPVSTNAEVYDYVLKLDAYENLPNDFAKAKNVQIINDDYNEPFADWEDPFVDLMVWLKTNIPSSYDIDHIDLLDVDGNTAKTRLFNNFANGLGLLVYMGHSYTKGWTDIPLIETDTVLNLDSSMPIYPLTLSFTCLTGSFSSAFDVSLGEAMMKERLVGSIAFIGSHGLTYALPQQVLAETFITELLDDPNATLGTLFQRTKQRVYEIGLNEDVQNSYNILGDPSIYTKGFYSDGAEDLTASGDSTNAPSASVSDSNASPKSNSGSGCGFISGYNNIATLIIMILMTLGLLACRKATRVRIKHNPRSFRHRPPNTH